VLKVDARFDLFVLENPVTVDIVCAYEIYPIDPRPARVEGKEIATPLITFDVVEITCERER
jgi:hypothetical protein